MKNIKFVLGLGIIAAVIDVAVLYVLQIAKVIEPGQFSAYLPQSLAIIGIAVLAILLVALIVGGLGAKRQ